MNARDKNILRWYLIGILASVLFVPWTDPRFHVMNYGYGLVFFPPNDHGVVDYGRIFLEIVALSCIVGLWMLKSRLAKSTETDSTRDEAKGNDQRRERPERPWHQFFRVFIYISTLLVTSGVLVSGYNAAWDVTFSYSFEPNYISEPHEQLCTIGTRAVDCGELRTVREFLDRYFQASSREELSLYEKLIPTDDELARSLLEKKEIRYRTVKHLNTTNFLILTIVAIGVGIAWYFLSLLLYKTILFLAYGHTRIRKVGGSAGW